MRSKLIPTKRKYLEWEIIKGIAFIVVMGLLLFQAYQLNQIRMMQVDILNTQNEVMISIDKINYAAAPNEESLIVEYADRLGIEISSYVVDTSKIYGVDPKLVFAIIEVESNFNPDAISSTGDYGLMQINLSNLPKLHEALGTTDLLDPYQNIEAGVYWCAGIKANNHGSIEKDLMVYNQGSRGAMRLWEDGVYSTDYSRAVVDNMTSM